MSKLSKTQKIKSLSLYKSQIFVSLGAFLLFVVLVGLSSRSIPEENLPDDIAEVEDPTTALGVFYVTRTKQPMAGVKMLKSSLEKNQNNKEVYWYLGQFSVRSGQYDKAIGYFEKLLTLENDPSERFKTMIYLEDANINNDDIKGALLVLKRMKIEFENDPEISQLIDERIEFIKDSLTH